VEQPPVEQPPVEEPPVEQPPVEQPPVEEPPVEQPPAEQPPVGEPPVGEPPVEEPPVEEPPVEQTPVPQPPTNPSPSDAGSQLVLAPVDAGTAPEDTEGGTTTEPVTSAPNYDPVLGSGTDPPASEPIDEPTTLVTLAERIDNLAGRAGNVLGGLAQALGALLGGDGTPNPGGSPVVPPDTPPDTPIPVFPASPGGSSPDGSFFSGASAGSGNAFVPLFGAIALLALALMRGGKPWWLRGETSKLKSALQLAIERPG
jgi:hypothetical protein